MMNHKVKRIVYSQTGICLSQASFPQTPCGPLQSLFSLRFVSFRRFAGASRLRLICCAPIVLICSFCRNDEAELRLILFFAGCSRNQPNRRCVGQSPICRESGSCLARMLLFVLECFQISRYRMARVVRRRIRLQAPAVRWAVALCFPNRMLLIRGPIKHV